MEGIPSGASLGSTGAKFGRKFALTIDPAYKIIEGKYIKGDDDPIIIGNPLTISFDIQRNTLASSNTATFRLYNLSENTRNQLRKDPHTQDICRPVMLQAGYIEPLPAIFIGQVIQAISYKEEGAVNVITEIQGFDFAFAMANAHSSWTVNNPTTKKDVIARLIGDLKGYQVKEGYIGDFEGEYARGYVACSPTWEALQKETGRNVFIDSGKVHCLKDDDCFEGNVTVISSETGLLGSPKRGEYTIIADMIFEPRLQIGQVVELNSKFNRDFNQQYKVIGIRHSGTISDAVAGKCRTTVNLCLGDQVLNVLKGKAG
jgi:hypothetical protein